jgi:hypothetical protein
MRVLATRADVAVAILSAPTEAALALAIADADGVILVLERPRLTAEMVRAAPRRLSSAMRLMKLGTSMPVGQACMQGAS